MSIDSDNNHHSQMSLDREKLSDWNSIAGEDNYCSEASLYQNQVPDENSSDDEDDQSQVSLNQDKLSNQNSDSNEDDFSQVSEDENDLSDQDSEDRKNGNQVAVSSDRDDDRSIILPKLGNLISNKSELGKTAVICDVQRKDIYMPQILKRLTRPDGRKKKVIVFGIDVMLVIFARLYNQILVST